MDEITQKLAWAEVGEVSVENQLFKVGAIEPEVGNKIKFEAMRLFQQNSPAYRWLDETTFQATNVTSTNPPEPKPPNSWLFHSDWTAQHKK